MLAFLKKVWLWERNKDAWTQMVSIENKYWLAPAGVLSYSGLESDVKSAGMWKPLTVLIDQNKSSI